MNIATNTDIAYIAGYIDGDGCFSIRDNAKKRNGTIHISSTNKDILYEFACLFGGSVQISKSGKTPRQKPCHQFIIGGKPSYEFTKKLLPFLVEKRNEALLYISFFETSCYVTRQKIIDDLKIAKSERFLVCRDDITKLNSISKTMDPSEEEFAYFAGFVDAECCLSISVNKRKNRPYPYYKIVLSCNNSKSPNFYWIKARFGGFVHFVDRKAKGMACRNQIMWRLCSRQLFNILPKIQPFLRYKRPVCDKLIELVKLSFPKGDLQMVESIRKTYHSTLAIRDEIVRAVHQLNHKGITPLGG